MNKNKLDNLFKRGVLTQDEYSSFFEFMQVHDDGSMTGGITNGKASYKYHLDGDIFDQPLLDFLLKEITPPMEASEIDPVFGTYGMMVYGICDYWHWFRRGSMTDYAIEHGHKPIEDASELELWKMIAIASRYWESSYKEWLSKSEEKSNLLDRFIGDCERSYFGYDEDGYTLKTIHRIFDSVKEMLEKYLNKI